MVGVENSIVWKKLKLGYYDEDGSLLPIEVTVKIVDINEFPPQLLLSDSIIRISDGELINPFAIEVTSSSLPTKNEIIWQTKWWDGERNGQEISYYFKSNFCR